MNINEQIKCVSREVNNRRKNYRQKVIEGLMTDEECTWEIRTMEHVLMTLQNIVDKDQMKLF